MLIGQLSTVTGVSRRLLRYYEQRGLLRADRDGNGYRSYPPHSVTTVRQIRALLAAGLTTDVIAEVLPCARGAQPEWEMCPRLGAVLGRELARMDERIGSLRLARDALACLLPKG